MRRRDFCWTPALAALKSCRRKDRGVTRTVHTGVLNFPGMSPFFLALERGHFRSAGLDAQPQFVNSTAQATALLAAGRLDAAITTVSPALFNAVARGAPVRVVLGRDRITPSCGDAGVLYARTASFPRGTSDIRQWNRKRICTGLRMGLGEFLLDTILSGAGLDPRQTPRPDLNSGQAAAALVSGGIDAMLNGNNLPLDFSSHREIVLEDAGAKALTNLQISHILFGEGLVRGDVRMGAAFLSAYLRGLREYLAGATPQFLRDFVAANGRDPSVIAQCRAYSTPDGSVDVQSIRSIADWAVARGYSAPGARAEDVVDTRFWELAHREGIAE